MPGFAALIRTGWAQLAIFGVGGWGQRVWVWVGQGSEAEDGFDGLGRRHVLYCLADVLERVLGDQPVDR
jgi:hypothetical protein